MTAPGRVQRARTKGWRAPAGAVYVGRGSRWGNPFKVGGRYVSRTAFHQAPYTTHHDHPLGTYQHPAWGFTPAWTQVVGEVRDAAHAVELFRAHIAHEDADWDPEEIRGRLGNRPLMCWCPLDQPCHGDVLLAIANPGAAS